jgi:hypothetical protein
LHIGAGTSRLSDKMTEVLTQSIDSSLERGERSGALIVNTDFSEAVVERGREMQAQLENQLVTSVVRTRWERIDLLNKDDILDLLQAYGGDNGDQSAGFDVVIDKSTSDAISCALDIDVKNDKLGSGPSSGLLQTQIAALDSLALYLAAVIKPRGVWIALSYSSDRFPLLCQARELGVRGDGSQDALDPLTYWRVEQRKAVDAPSGQGRVGVHAPPVQHWIYVLRRSNNPMNVLS